MCTVLPRACCRRRRRAYRQHDSQPKSGEGRLLPLHCRHLPMLRVAQHTRPPEGSGRQTCQKSVNPRPATAAKERSLGNMAALTVDQFELLQRARRTSDVGRQGGHSSRASRIGVAPVEAACRTGHRDVVSPHVARRASAARHGAAGRHQPLNARGTGARAEPAALGREAPRALIGAPPACEFRASPEGTRRPVQFGHFGVTSARM